MDKAHPWMAELARRFTGRGFNVLAIDAPGHGERRRPGATDWPRPDPDESNAAWRTALDVAAGTHDVDTDRLAYWGISMGAALGMSLLAGDPRVRAAVVGHMHADWPKPPGRRIRADAAALTAPVLFLANWDDQSAPRESAFELFDLIGSPDKRLLVHPGGHAQVPTEALDASEAFIDRHLSPPRPS
jgi:alpha-beta hydrolase superfamily lysophospholipase